MRRTLKCITALFIVLAFGGVTLTSADFEYPDFSTTTDLNVVGDAAFTDSIVRLTPNLFNQAGGAWHESLQYVESGFVTTFRFQITTTDAVAADGLAFVIQNELDGSDALGLGGGGLGYNGLFNSVAIEFDTYFNGGHGDPDGNHISVQFGGRPYQWMSLATTKGRIPILEDGEVHTVRIQYEPPPSGFLPGRLSVYIDDMKRPVFSAALVLDQLIDLDEGSAYVGFTAATGAAREAHDILGWSFASAPKYPFEEFELGRMELGFDDDDGIRDHFYAAGGFTLGADSDGIDVLTEDVKLQIGPAVFKIPAGSFSLMGSRYVWSGEVDGVLMSVELRQFPAGPWGFRFEGAATDLSGCANPELWRVSIGDDGSTMARRLDGVLRD